MYGNFVDVLDNYFSSLLLLYCINKKIIGLILQKQSNYSWIAIYYSVDSQKSFPIVIPSKITHRAFFYQLLYDAL
jgi:hypothetical protein